MGRQTPQVPPYPMVTLSSSTMTGTSRTPEEYFNISSSLLWSAWTSKNSASAPNADLASCVWGQPNLP
jgi:hypothetical protein